MSEPPVNRRIFRRATRIFELSSTIGSIENSDSLPDNAKDEIVERSWHGLHRLGVERTALDWSDAVRLARESASSDRAD